VFRSFLFVPRVYGYNFLLACTRFFLLPISWTRPYGDKPSLNRRGARRQVNAVVRTEYNIVKSRRPRLRAVVGRGAYYYY